MDTVKPICRNCEAPIFVDDAVIEVRKVVDIYDSGDLKTDRMNPTTSEYRHAFCKTVRSRTR